MHSHPRCRYALYCCYHLSLHTNSSDRIYCHNSLSSNVCGVTLAQKDVLDSYTTSTTTCPATGKGTLQCYAPFVQRRASISRMDIRQPLKVSSSSHQFFTGCHLIDLSRLLHQQHLTIDSNYLSSHQVKNCSHKDISLHKGDTYYPEQEAYKSTVASASKPGQEVCDSLNGL
jgi:hypothetical protein